MPGVDVELRFSLIGDGRSNITYRVDGGDRTWVLRRPPLGYVLPTAHDMAREFRVLEGLADTAVPVPRPIALCEDEAVNERPFYVMEYRPGTVLDGTGSWDVVATPEKRRRMSEALVDGLVALHAVDCEAVGLGNFGRPQGYLERQVRRWLQQWERSTTGTLPVIEELIRRLQAALPESLRIVDVAGPGKTAAGRSTAVIHFYPSGVSDMAIIHCEVGGADSVSIRVEPFLPEVTIREARDAVDG